MKYNREDTCMNAIVNAAFQAMLDSTSDMVFVKDANLVYVAASMPFVNMVGKETVDEIVGRTDQEIFADENLAKRYVADDRKLLSGGKNLIDYVEPITDDNGQARYGSTSKYILSDQTGETIGILGITRDITRDYIARQHYQQELKYLFEIPSDTYGVSYIDVDSWRIITQRRQLINECTLPPCNTVEELCEAALATITDSESDAAQFFRDFSPEYLRNIYESGRDNKSYKCQRLLPDGAIHWIYMKVKFLTDIDSGHLCVMISAKDIDAEKLKEQELVEAARMDQMTKLLNRETTMESIKLVLAEEADSSHVLFMIDVDNFKLINDTLGHQTGDEFLIAFASEIKKNFRETDIVGRIGGDEFFALMRNVSDISKIEKKAKGILCAAERVCADYPSIRLSASIGISRYPENGRMLQELYAQADSALYEAKRNGKNQFIIS